MRTWERVAIWSLLWFSIVMWWGLSDLVMQLFTEHEVLWDIVKGIIRKGQV